MTDKVLAASAETSPDALLKQAILGARATAAKSADAPAAPAKRSFRLDPRLAGFSGAALGLGILLGAGATSLTFPRASDSGQALGQIRQQVEALRTESERQAERLGKGLAQVQEGTDSARSEAKTRQGALNERIGRAEQALGAKVTAMGERLEQAEKEQSARLATLTSQVEKRFSQPVPASAAPAPQAAKPAAPEPTETGSIADKPKPAAETWAVRHVYDGIAVLEDRKRRLIEVGPGDTVPGLGRVEAVERRGKAWVVVTRQGIVTPQTW